MSKPAEIPWDKEKGHLLTRFGPRKLDTTQKIPKKEKFAESLKEAMAKEFFPKSFDKDPEKYRGRPHKTRFPDKVSVAQMRALVARAKVGNTLLAHLQNSG